jgi:hypothetical protein
MAAANITGVQHRQRFDAWGAKRLRNRQRFAGLRWFGRGSSAAVAGSVWTLGIWRISDLRLVALFGKLASPALAFGPGAGFLISLP